MTARAAGRFITFEGIDGSGKSTQARLAAERLRRSGATVVETREPGGSPGAELIRDLLVRGDTARWSPETEILLFTAARRDHVERTIRPALGEAGTVICDRYVDSTRVYQGVARADLITLVDALHDLSVGLEPDLTIVIDIDAEAAAARSAARASGEDRFERFGVEFQRRLRRGFLDIAAREPGRCRVVSGDGAPADVAARVAEAMDR